MRGTLKATAVILLVLSLGLHWTLLQTVAWTGMVINYSRGSSLDQAISMTFDGEHPCPMCKAIKQGKSEERERNQEITKSGKLELALPWTRVAFIFGSTPEAIAPPALSILHSRIQTPPSPPPKVGLASGHLC